MKSHTVTTYTATELREQFPQGFKRALDRWQNRGEIFWQDETIDSLKSLIKSAGLNLRDWSLGAYNRGNHIKIEWNDEVADMHGKRAMAWVENNLLAQFRIPWSGKRRQDVRKYGKLYRPGLITPCPFTGYYTDEDYIRELRKAIRKGETLKEAFEGLADVCQDLLESECEAQNEPDYFCEHAEANEMEFTEDGEIF